MDTCRPGRLLRLRNAPFRLFWHVASGITPTKLLFQGEWAVLTCWIYWVFRPGPERRIRLRAGPIPYWRTDRNEPVPLGYAASPTCATGARHGGASIASVTRYAGCLPRDVAFNAKRLARHMYALISREFI